MEPATKAQEIIRDHLVGCSETGRDSLSISCFVRNVCFAILCALLMFLKLTDTPGPVAIYSVKRTISALGIGLRRPQPCALVALK